MFSDRNNISGRPPPQIRGKYSQPTLNEQKKNRDPPQFRSCAAILTRALYHLF